MWAFVVLCFRNQLHSGALMIVIEKSGLLKFTALSAKLTSQERAKQTKRGRLCVGSASRGEGGARRLRAEERAGRWDSEVRGRMFQARKKGEAGKEWNVELAFLWKGFVSSVQFRRGLLDSIWPVSIPRKRPRLGFADRSTSINST